MPLGATRSGKHQNEMSVWIPRITWGAGCHGIFLELLESVKEKVSRSLPWVLMWKSSGAVQVAWCHWSRLAQDELQSGFMEAHWEPGVKHTVWGFWSCHTGTNQGAGFPRAFREPLRTVCIPLFEWVLSGTCGKVECSFYSPSIGKVYFWASWAWWRVTGQCEYIFYTLLNEFFDITFIKYFFSYFYLF